jgi:hypothetical protein
VIGQPVNIPIGQPVNLPIGQPVGLLNSGIWGGEIGKHDDWFGQLPWLYGFTWMPDVILVVIDRVTDTAAISLPAASVASE